MREGAIEVDLSQQLCDDGHRREAGIGYGGALRYLSQLAFFSCALRL